METRWRCYPEFSLPKPKIKRSIPLEFRHNRVPTAPDGDEESIDKESQDMLCVNCLDSVSKKAIDMHVQTCVAYVSLVSDDGLYSLKNSLVKYKAYMEHLQDTSEDPVPKLLAIQTDKLLNASSQSSVLSVSQETQKILDSYYGTIHIKMCIDRLLAFANKKAQLIEISQQRAEKLKSIKKGIQKIGSHREAPKKTLTDAYSIQKDVIEDLQSELNTHIETEKFSSSLNASTLFSSTAGSPGHDSSKHEFYTRCLMAKHNFPPKHPVQKTPIHVLYKRAVDKNIQPDNWDMFINQELKAMNYSKKTPSKLNSHRVLPTRIHSIEEEE